MVAVNSVWGGKKTCFSWTVTYIATAGCGSEAEAGRSKHSKTKVKLWRCAQSGWRGTNGRCRYNGVVLPGKWNVRKAIPGGEHTKKEQD